MHTYRLSWIVVVVGVEYLLCSRAHAYAKRVDMCALFSCNTGAMFPQCNRFNLLCIRSAHAYLEWQTREYVVIRESSGILRALGIIYFSHTQTRLVAPTLLPSMGVILACNKFYQPLTRTAVQCFSLHSSFGWSSPAHVTRSLGTLENPFYS